MACNLTACNLKRKFIHQHGRQGSDPIHADVQRGDAYTTITFSWLPCNEDITSHGSTIIRNLSRCRDGPNWWLV